jgi:chaperonin GroEL (HSP60 family)
MPEGPETHHERKEHPGDSFIVLSKHARRFSKKDSYRLSIETSESLVQALKSTLGPAGMDKLIVSSGGSYLLTNDGYTILETLQIEQPIGKVLVEAAKTQDDEVGDGTTSAVVLAGEMLKSAADLLDMGLHPNLLISGYEKATREALRALDTLSERVGRDDDAILLRVCETAMTGKYVEDERTHLARLCLQAAKEVVERKGGERIVSLDRIKIAKRVSGKVRDTSLIRGIVLPYERPHPGLPRRVEKARIALIGSHINLQFLSSLSPKAEITTSEGLKEHTLEEGRLIREKAGQILRSGANVLLCDGKVDERLLHLFSRKGVYVLESLVKTDLQRLAMASGGTIVTELESLRRRDLGRADLVEERLVSGEAFTFIEGCRRGKAVTLFLRGAADYVLKEVERCLIDGISVVGAMLRDRRYLPGGGAIEVELARRVREKGRRVGDRRQLAYLAYANALESIPKALAENGGLDPTEWLLKLRSAHEKDGAWMGLDLDRREVWDVREMGVLEPYRVKAQILKSALDAVTAVLRVDEMIIDEPRKKESSPPSTGPE